MAYTPPGAMGISKSVSNMIVYLRAYWLRQLGVLPH